MKTATIELTPEQQARFWSYVEKGDGCWTWRGAMQRTGYGQFGVRYGITRQAHRISYALLKGSPDGMLVCHQCDNPVCVKPDHLFLGDQSKNMRDASLKGRIATGDRHGTRTNPAAFRLRVNAGYGRIRGFKLTQAKVDSMRSEFSAGASKKSLARKYGVATSTVREILNREYWK